jgi:vacuolar-type H+-ATPase subunit E/Vma4
MEPDDPHAVERLRAAVLDDARSRAADIAAKAASEAEAILARAAQAAEQQRASALADARANAARRRDNLLATVPIVVERHRAARTEGILRAIHDTVRRRLATPPAAGRVGRLAALASEALRAMEGDDFTLRISPADRGLGDAVVPAILRELAPRLPRLTLHEDPSVAAGGVLVESADGRQVWDNRLNARFERLWPDLRRQIVGQFLLPDRGGA